LRTFLQLDSEVAEANACRMEHHIDDQTLERLIAFIKFVQQCPRTGPDWLRAFTRFCDQKGRCENCLYCLRQCLEDYENKES
jgi:DtxR family Mn-dependent transcriptional regulator